MFEREIQFIFDFNYNKVKKLGSFVTYEQLLHSQIHPAILQYISGEIDFLIFEDRQKLLRDSLFDYSGEKISDYFSQISEEIKKTKRFSQNYIEKLILHATSFTVHYLSRPNWSMLKFIFDDEKNKSILEVKQLFNYFYYYPSLKKVMLSYFDKKNLKSVSYDELNELLHKIDSIGLESDYNKVVEDALDMMSEFYNIGMSNRKYVPLDAVELYLKEKNLTSFLDKLSKDFNNPEVTRYDISEYKNAFSGIIVEFDEEVETKKDSEKPIEFEEEHESIEISSLDTFGDEPSFDANEISLTNETEEINYAASAYDSEEELTGEVSETDNQDIDSAGATSEENSTLDDITTIAETGKGPEEELSILQPDEEVEELDIAEDERIDSESLQEGIELIKEEKEITELSPGKAQLDEENDVPDDEKLTDQKFVFEDYQQSQADNEPMLASDLLDKELDEAKALYLEETESDSSKPAHDLIDRTEEKAVDISINSQLAEDEEVTGHTIERSPSEILDEAISNLDKTLNDFDAKEQTTEEDTDTEVSQYPGTSDSLEKGSEIQPAIEAGTGSPLYEDDSDSVNNEQTEVNEGGAADIEREEEITEESFETAGRFYDEGNIATESKPGEDFEEGDKQEEKIEMEEMPQEVKGEKAKTEPEEDSSDEINLKSMLYNDTDDKPNEETELNLFEDKEEEIPASLKSEDVLIEVNGDVIETPNESEPVDQAAGVQHETTSLDDTRIEDPIEYQQTVEASSSVGGLDLNELLENKKMNKIVESVFDYDMEDFANAIEKIAEARDKDDALLTVEKICETAQFGSNSKEAKLFKSIIADYFDQ